MSRKDLDERHNRGLHSNGNGEKSGESHRHPCFQPSKRQHKIIFRDEYGEIELLDPVNDRFRLTLGKTCLDEPFDEAVRVSECCHRHIVPQPWVFVTQIRSGSWRTRLKKSGPAYGCYAGPWLT